MAKTKNKSVKKNAEPELLLPKEVSDKYINNIRLGLSVAQSITIGTILHPEFNLDKIPRLTQQNRDAIIAVSNALKEHFGEHATTILINIIGLHDTLFVNSLVTSKKDIEFILDKNQTDSMTIITSESNKVN